MAEELAREFEGRPIEKFFFSGSELEELGPDIVSSQRVSWFCAVSE